MFRKPHLLKPFALLSIFLACGLFSLHVYKKKQDENRAKQQKIEQELEKKERAELNSLFVLYIDNFKSDLKEQAKSYKESRRVLKEIFSPLNFETPEFTKENYTLFKNRVAPALREKSEKIISIFQNYTDRLKDDLKDVDSEIQKKFLVEWTKMSNEQLKNYVDFFANEEKLIQAYDELITFYYAHSNLFSIDIENNKFLFERDKDKEKEAEIQKRIKNLKKK